MKNLKPMLARLLAAILVVSSLTPSGMANAAPPAADTLESQKKTERFQDMDTSTASDAVNDQEALTQVSQTLKNDASGTCGDNLIWNLENGILTINGTGNMKSSPWENRKAENGIRPGRLSFHLGLPWSFSEIICRIPAPYAAIKTLFLKKICKIFSTKKLKTFPI
ncbi:MAG: hypothetical protein HFG77_02765 [Hungatella sp.]|jgi:hypothetical protein|nr:hypothetical protein [Hungatella sp.]